MRIFEVGDKVVVRKNFWENTPAKYREHVGINVNMKTFSGQMATIERCRTHSYLGERTYYISVDGRVYTWVSDWLQHVEIEVKEGDYL